jgi:hypothetical protein
MNVIADATWRGQLRDPFAGAATPATPADVEGGETLSTLYYLPSGANGEFDMRVDIAATANPYLLSPYLVITRLA